MEHRTRLMQSSFWNGQSLRNVLTGVHTEFTQEMLFLQGYTNLLANSELEPEKRSQMGQSMNEHIEFMKSVLVAVAEYLSILGEDTEQFSVSPPTTNA